MTRGSGAAYLKARRSVANYAGSDLRERVAPAVERLAAAERRGGVFRKDGATRRRFGIRRRAATEAVEMQRRWHRKLGVVELRQAPSLMARVQVREAIWQWCVATGSAKETAAWRMLGKAILFSSVGAQMLMAVRSAVGEGGARLAGDWLLWHRRRRAFSKADLKCCKKLSKARVVWDTLRRGTGSSSGQRAWDACRTAPCALSREAAKMLVSLRSQGFVSCEVGRLPFHLKGELPGARLTRGRIKSYCWVEEQQGAASEADVLKLLACTSSCDQRPRRPVLLYSEGELPALLRVGERKLVSKQQLGQVRALVQAGSDPRTCVEAWKRFKAPTLTSSRGLSLLLVSSPRLGVLQTAQLTAQDWATLMGVPIDAQHPVRRGLMAVSEAVGRSIIGQALHFDVAVCLLKKLVAGGHLGGSQSADGLTYISLLSGIDIMAAAVDFVVGGHWRFALAAEANATVASALQAAWGGKLLKVVPNALGDDAIQAVLERRGQVDIMMLSLRCAPWSTANSLPVADSARQEQLERALEENQALLELAAAALPRVIILECVDGLLRSCVRSQWCRLQGMIGRHKAWSWSRQLICPQLTLHGAIPRRRVWVIGVWR